MRTRPLPWACVPPSVPIVHRSVPLYPLGPCPSTRTQSVPVHAGPWRSVQPPPKNSYSLNSQSQNNPRSKAGNSKIRASIGDPKTPSSHNFFYSFCGRDLLRFRGPPKHEFFDKFVQHRAIIEGRISRSAALGRPVLAIGLIAYSGPRQPRGTTERKRHGSV